jgi:Zn-dependent M28 family amino/carboxypeptidase
MAEIPKSLALRYSSALLKLNFTVDVVRLESPSFNVIGILPGSDPNLKNEAIVIGAHYDHLGRGGEGSLAPREGEIHHGADDNASGVAGLIELARMLSTQNPKPRRTIVFIAFSGEEEGLIGSSYYANHPIIPLANTVAMINMDMIGRLKERNLIVGGVGTAQEWRSMIDADNAVKGVEVSANSPVAAATVSLNLPTVIGGNELPTVTVDAGKQFALTLNEDGFGPSIIHPSMPSRCRCFFSGPERMRIITSPRIPPIRSTMWEKPA